MNKNWGDRADKDLFFTILSIKNIGVISGAEWSDIGNHMRALGYGFTNEGCRQHFQGLRRSQHKGELNGNLDGPPRKGDPTQNPITRRPGPGRGRPRKHPLDAAAAVGHEDVPRPPASVAPASASAPAVTEAEEAEATALNALAEATQQPSDPSEPILSTEAPIDISLTEAPPDSMTMNHGNGTLEEPPTKRQRLEELEPPPPSDDEALLALAAEGLTGPGDDYDPPEYYDEA